MTLFYSPLFNLAIENDYYGELACPDLTIKPTLETVKTLQRNAWILRGGDSRFLVLAKVKADTTNPNLPSKTLFYPLDSSDSPVLRFTVSLRNPNFHNFTDLDRTIQSGKRIFYLNNIHNFNTNKGKFLKNSVVLPNPAVPVAHSNIPTNNDMFGASIKWLNRLVYRNAFSVAANVSTATVKLQARHHDTHIVHDLGEQVFNFPTTHPVENVEYALDLSKVNNLPEGRYTFSDDKGNSETVFYAPECYTESPIGMVELFGKIGNQPLLNGNLVSENHYKMRFSAKKVILQYHVENTSRKPAGDLRHRLNDLTVDTFIKSVIIADSPNQYGKVAFTAPSLLPLDNNISPSLDLKHSSNNLIKLPKPQPQLLPEWHDGESRYYVRISANV